MQRKLTTAEVRLSADSRFFLLFESVDVTHLYPVFSECLRLHQNVFLLVNILVLLVPTPAAEASTRATVSTEPAELDSRAELTGERNSKISANTVHDPIHLFLRKFRAVQP